MLAESKWSRKTVAALLVLAFAATIVITGLPATEKAQAAYVDPDNYVIGLKTPARVTKLIYPTIGNPSIVKRGTTLTAEWDPREGTYYKAPSYIPLPECTDFTATVTSSNGGNGTITKTLPVTEATPGQSARWPGLANPLPAPGNNQVYHVTVQVPDWLPLDLYDLTLSCTIEGSQYSDSQPNAVDVINEFKTDFNFIQVSDIHVFGPENKDASFFYKHSRTERGNRTTSYDAGPTGAGYGARYLHKEIMEINRMKPDFAILTGDYIFGQRYFAQDEPGGFGYCTQYEYEMEWFYQEISKLEVPAFFVIGNHDGYYYDTSQGGPVTADWFTYWAKLFGPAYYEFEYGPANKFLAVNSMDWIKDDRWLTDYFGIILQPTKYLGAVRAGGDNWQSGISQQRLDQLNPNNFLEQLSWLKEKLEASQGAAIRIMAMHHDPWKENAYGSMWAGGGEGWLEQILGYTLNMGDGPGRLALIKLATTYKVALMIHGHDHSDCTSEDDAGVAFLDWAGGGGRCISANTTSSSFQGDDDKNVYPGFRRVWVSNGAVTLAGNESLNYVEPFYAWPAYKNTNVGGTTDLGNLSTPALEQTWTATPGPATEDVTCNYSNHYAKPLNNVYAEFPMKMLTGGYYYTVSNGTWGETFDVSGSTRMNQVYTNLASGQQNKAVRVQKSAAPDTTAPTGSVLIDDGEPVTESPNVTLALSASDAQSGVGEMMVSNSEEFTGAVWEPYKTAKSWTLEGEESGYRTVYVKYRDRAMPANEVTKTDTIYYEYTAPSGPRIVSVSPNHCVQNEDNVNVNIVGENTHFVEGTSNATLTKPGGSGIQIWETIVTDATHCTVVFKATDATVGKWDVGVTVPGELVTPLHEGFTIDGPAIIDVSPGSGSAGQTMSVAITKNGMGYDFVQGSCNAHFLRDGEDEGGIAVNSTNVTDANHCTANIAINKYCEGGPVDVSVTNGPDVCAPLVGGFQVISHNPRIVSVSPQAGLRGQTLNVNVLGADTSFTAASRADFGSGITVNSTTRNSPTDVTANITISASATPGSRDVNVETGDESPQPLTAGFAVEDSAPVVTSITPSSAMDSGTVNITNLAGGNFKSGATVKLVKASQSDIVATDVNRVSSTKITCKFNLTAKMAGAWDVVVTNPDGKKGTLEGGFTVRWATPTVTSINPAFCMPGDKVEPARIGGTNFREGATVVLKKTGQPDIQPTAYLGTTLTEIQCNFDFTGKKEGRYNVVVTNADGQVATLVNGFAVRYPQAPTLSGIDPATGETGDVVPVTVTGGYFQEGVVVLLKNETYGTVSSSAGTVSAEKDSFTCDLDLSGAHWGYWGVQVMNDDGQLSNTMTNTFRVTKADPPALTGVTPSTAARGTTVTLAGESFGHSRSDSVVKFNGTAATSYSAWSDTSIKCKVPSGATSGEVTVTTVSGTSNGVDFTVTGAPDPDPDPDPDEPDKPAWYLAEGTSDYGFGTYINIQNPNRTPVTAMVTYMTKAGPRTRAALRLEPLSQTVVNPLDDVGATDFSTKVECKEGKTICVDRRMVWTGPGAPASEGHSSVGVTSPAKTWYLAEGSSKWGFETWLLIQNPNTKNANVTITYMIEGRGPVPVKEVVKANSRASFNMETHIGQCDASIKVDADVPVIPERAMYRHNRREGHDSIGTTTPAKDYYLAEGTTDWGFTTYVLVQNPNGGAASVNVTYMTPTGPVEQAAFSMEPNSRKTINVNQVPGMEKTDCSIHVAGSLPIIAERAMYWGAGTPLGEACHASIGMSEPHMAFLLPDGETYNDTETWTLVQNPNSVPVNVVISYLCLGGQGNGSVTATIPANSRKTFNMSDRLPSVRAAVLVESKTPGKPIMVERSMYWGGRGGGTDTIGGYID